MSLGENIKRIRKERKLSQRELANMVGVKTPSICFYEKNERQPRLEIVKKIATALEVTIDELICEGDFNTNYKIIDTETKIALMLRIKEIIDYLRDDFFRDYGVDKLETLLNEIKNDNIVPF